MKKKALRLFTLLATVIFLSATAMEFEAHARIGGGRSMGSYGSRSYSRPSTPSSPYRSQPTTSPATGYQQPASGGFLRSMGGGIMGGMLGGMLFRGLGFGGMGGMGGGGIGLFEIILLAGIGYLIFNFIKRRRADNPINNSQSAQYGGGTVTPLFQNQQNASPGTEDVATGLAHIRQFDPSFDENRYNDLVMDNFFKIQGAWMNRDLAPVQGLLTDEMRRIFQGDLDKLISDKQINRLENIAVRNVDIVEAWQESGQDYINTLIYANLLDYTTDENGTVVSGSKSDPVKFEEFWTFTRPVGNNQWQLTAINQKQ
ncbi:MAG: Tim44 domain-containing protein [Desulfuromonadaceae bacterium]|nr:Tim44 domain-containing protein [Desulfuromonadaceae bacterium]MDD2849320.1 Tim44 domain-containing protein [Desulfuromonadaceae bacterium]MDD4129379.1 Tim44 domain-containing protein [Desulfuromonadaceae bacterium]